MTRRVMPWEPGRTSHEVLLEREWIVTNGISGYASGTVAGALTRKYHGLLVAALPPPLGRVVMWNYVAETLLFEDGATVSLGGDNLREFRLDDGLPVWTYEVRGVRLEKRIILPQGQNTVHVSYCLDGANDMPRLDLRPAFQFRPHDSAVDQALFAPYELASISSERFEVATARDDLPVLRMRVSGGVFRFQNTPAGIRDVFYRTEAERGYASQGDLWSPGVFQLTLERGSTATLTASTESWASLDAVLPAEATCAEEERRLHLLAQAGSAAVDEFAAELILAADQFIITPPGREGARTVIAGYHWFTDWGRDTMIALEGLTLATGRSGEARDILRTFAQYVRDGLIPNLFPDGQSEGLYHTADATLWFFHALGRYLRLTNDQATVRELLPTMVEIAEAHLRGTKFNIHVDPADGLLVQGTAGFQLTWMDAKMGDWVVTPRHGKAVEINALWYNALRYLESWLRELGDAAAVERYAQHANRARDSFNRCFWFADGGHLYDVIDIPGAEDDPACRPNQIFAISLDHPILAEERWAGVLSVVENELLTPVGLRSLSPRDAAYQPRYGGDLRTRDAAYHQGTVWAWLIGPFIDAWQKVYPNPNDQAGARHLLAAFPRHLSEAGIGSISEVFHGNAPHIAGGCIAQAWSVAEVLRCWLQTAEAEQ